MNKKGFDLKANFFGSENVFGSFQPKASNKNEKVTVFSQGKRSLVVKVENDGKVHFELYWFILPPSSDELSRDDLFRDGQDVIVKVFSISEDDSPDYFRDFVLENPDFDPWRYCKVEFDIKRFLKENPYASENAWKLLM